MTGLAWEDPRLGEKGLGLAQLGAEPNKGLYSAFTLKPDSIREGKTAYMV